MTVEAVPAPLPEATIAAVTELARAASHSDGVAPLNEATRLDLATGGAGGIHLLQYDGEALAGYAHLDPDGSAELVVAPNARRQGVGTALGQALLAEAGESLRIWAHGRLPGADELAARLGLEPARELFFLARDASTAVPLPEVVLAPAYELRTFVPGQDDKAWLAVNARAFATHPEQGSWTQADLDERLGQEWFDPAAFFLAVERGSGRLGGYHWTKVEDGVGEVYVVGVDPSHQGTGLGKALTLAGLHHLHGKGLDRIVLYVDGTNTAARRLYESLGFTTAALDVQYAPATSG
ncbi:mycothiol synthase [Kribbella deserti]|uniref:Mycothiol acetyltransferase n=1 Tax=Kribbella deserti TaxID=1926257 RepID=A0ABV6QX48_9ACTN